MLVVGRTRWGWARALWRLRIKTMKLDKLLKLILAFGATTTVSVLIGLQYWILLEIVSLKERVVRVETKIEWWRHSNR